MSPQTNHGPLLPGPRGQDVPPAPDGGFGHVPVMLAEVLEAFEGVPAGWVVDATVGGGGHAAAILEHCPQLKVLGIDQDSDAISAAGQALVAFPGRYQLVKARFDGWAEVVATALGPAGPGGQPVAGAFFDLGVSSPQLDRPERGFSYRWDAPLDMRMDRSGGRTAADLVNSASPAELARLFAENGEGRFARRIAAAIAAARPLTTTGQLAEVVAQAVPAPARRRGHPAKRVFQALRTAVNSELEVLPVALDAALDRVLPGGRVVVISYHSGEDRAVKARFLEAASGGCTCPPGLPCACGAVPRARLLNRGARKPSAAEVTANPRAGSARFRAVEVVAAPGGGREAVPAQDRALHTDDEGGNR